MFFISQQIIFDFANQIDEELESSLGELNIEVRIDGKAVLASHEQEFVDIKTLNLDVTTMMASISSLTCESFDWEFDQSILTEQAIQESLSSTKVFLDELFKGKRMLELELETLKIFQIFIR